MPVIKGCILQVTEWQALFLPAGGKRARWLPRSEITLRDEKGGMLGAQAAARTRAEVRLTLPGWLARREGLKSRG